MPELGEKNVYSYSLYEIFRNKKFVNFEVETRGELIDAILNGNEQRHKEYNNKFSSEYLEELKKYISQLLTQKHFYELNILHPLLIDKLFYVGNEPHNIFERIQLICERIAEQKKLPRAQTNALKMRMTNIILKKFNIEQIYSDFMDKMGLASNKSYYDNLPTYVFINMCFSNYESDSFIKHIVIDEMQDYDAVSLKIVSMIYNKATLTILGDYYQNLIGKKKNLSSIENAFENPKLIELKTSYRSSGNIIEFANSVLGEKIAENHFREGERPKIYEVKNEEEMIKAINKQIEILAKNNEKIAILVKTKHQASNLHKKLNNCSLIIDDKNTDQIENDILISTIYLCKGLEFDSVIIPYLSQENYHTDLDKNNLYVAITRALHSVSGYFYGGKSEFVEEKYMI